MDTHYGYHLRSGRPPKSEPAPIKTSDTSMKFDKEVMAFVMEDTRLSTLQRKLVKENGSVKQLALAYQISECIMYTDNRTYVRRSSDIICEAITEIFFSSRHGDKVKTVSAEALARVGYVLAESNGSDNSKKEAFDDFYSWIWKTFKETKRESIQVYFLKCIGAFLCLKPPFMTDDEIQEILNDILRKLEETESSLMMTALVDSFQAASQWKPKLFEPHFQNVVDILVGWHIDSSQNPAVRSYVSKVLLSWHSFWILDMEFSSRLLKSFMEDLEAFTEDVARANTSSEVADFCERILSLTQVFNAVLSCLRSSMSRDRSNVVSFLPPESSTWCGIILKCLLTALTKRFDEDMIVAGQHAFLVLLERIEALPQLHQEDLMSFLSASLRNFDSFSFEGMSNVLRFTKKLFMAVNQTKIQRQIVQQLIGPSSSTGLVERCGLTRSQKVWEASTEFFKNLLNSEDILVLREVYSHLTGVYQRSLLHFADVTFINSKQKELKQQTNKSKSECLLFFSLECLSNLVVGKGSVLSMWALDPSIFIVLTRHSAILDSQFMKIHPWLHHAIVTTLYKHCHSNGHFVSTCNLISTSTLSNQSPTADNFKILLETLCCLLEAKDICPATMHLLVSWSKSILDEMNKISAQLQITFAFLLTKEPILKWFNTLLQLTYTTKRMEVKKDCFGFILGVLDQLSAPGVTFSKQIDIWTAVFKIAQKELDSFDPQVQESACHLILKLPPLITDFSKTVNEDLIDETRIVESKLKFLKEAPVNLRVTEFKVLADSLLKGSVNNSSLVRVFESHNVEPTFYNLCRSNEKFCVLWQNFQLAQSCVNTKLKTGLGNPKDTLTAFEKVLRQMAALAADNKPIPVGECRKVLSFFDLLEKSFVNASDGCSLNWATPSKTITTFFKANKKTCTEWLLRLRPSIILLAFHVGDFPFVLQNADRALLFLADKVQAGNLSEQDEVQLVQIVTMLSIALHNLESPQNLTGIYVWCKEKLRKRFPWLRSVIELARKKVEDGTQTFNTALINILEGPGQSDRLVCNLLNRQLFSAYADLCVSNEDYIEIVKKYKKLNSGPNYTTDYLETLSQFHDGQLPVGLKDSRDFVDLKDLRDFDESAAECTGTEESILRSHRLLLKGGAIFSNSCTTMQSWNQRDKLSTSLIEAKTQLDKLLTQHQLTEPQMQKVLILKAVHDELLSLDENRIGSLDRLLYHCKGRHSSSTLLWVKKWGEYFTRFRKTNPNYHRWLFQLNTLNVELAVTARKENNYNMSRLYLEKALGTVSFKSYIETFRFTSTVLSVDKASCLRQSAKLLRLQGEGELAVRTLCGVTVNVEGAIQRFHQDSNNTELLEISSRCLNNMALWFRADNSLLDKLYPDMMSLSDEGVSIAQVLDLEASKSDNLPSTESIADSEVVIYRLLNLAVNQAPTLSKIWSSFGNWCLELGEKTLSTSDDNKIDLSGDEEDTLIDIFEGTNIPKVVRNLLRQVHLKPSCQAAVETEKIALMKRELTDCTELSNVSDETIDRLHRLWQDIQRRIFFFHETAVNSYFKFISLCSDGSEDKIISATLRLLQLTVKHALELQESLQNGLATTPCGRWRSIIPQLFSRLNHPVRTVRNRISELLCRIAEEHSQLVIYPAVVGSMSAASSDTFSKLLSSAIVDDEKIAGGDGDEDKSPEMQSAHAKIVDAISKKSPSAILSIDQVRFMVIELQRISLLWDELWVGTIQQYGTEINRRVKKMDEEVKRLNVNSSLNNEEKKSLAREKYKIIFKPLLYVFDKVFSITSSPPETQNEKWFLKKYGDFLKNLMEQIRDPPDPTRPQDVWTLVDQFLNQKLQKKSGLKLQEISSALYNMRDTLVPMPGIVEDSKVGLVISSFENLLTVLPTKTKPKRIILTGSDGKKYTYLFKGLEDLHLDERIMQFLMIANKLMLKTGGEYRARHYSVVPLGVRSGLIQWVEGAVPLFGLYKRWQQRQLMGDQQNKGGNFQKPSDVFYNKLIPLLREQGITNMDNRREWPLPVMRQVLSELIAETPQDLLSQEVWFSSVDPQHWFNLTQNLIRSIAVMSIIGYIIGLGDRHLDNLLIDLKLGEIIHIDYNVCFEKGRNLRIPEQVPCRLTQNIVKVFGMTGVEGVFRLSCEHTLETMRTGRETFLTLLEAFVYDPLVDWTPGVELGLAGTYYQGGVRTKNMEAVQDKRDIQTEITFSMLSVRVAEIRGAWLDNRTHLSNSLSSVEESVSAWLDLNVGLQHLNSSLAKLHSGMSLLKEAEANPSHRLYALQDRYFEHTLTEAAVCASQAKVAAFIEEHERWLHLHQRAIICLSSNQLAAWTNETNEVTTKATSGSPTSRIIADFLGKAGQTPLLEEFERTEINFCQVVDQLKHKLLTGIQMLSHYASVALLYPQSYKSEHRTVRYLKWMSDISENFNFQTCQDVISDFNRHFVEVNPTRSLKQHQIVNVNFQLENWSQNLKFEIQKVYDRMLREGVKNSNAPLMEVNKNKSDIQNYLQSEHDSVKQSFGPIIYHKLTEFVGSLLTIESVLMNTPNGSTQNTDQILLNDTMVLVDASDQVLSLLDFFGCSSLSENEAMKCFLKMENVFKQLKSLQASFFSIILQEGLKSFQREELSTLNVSAQLNDLLGAARIPLENLIQDIDSQISTQEPLMESRFLSSIAVAKSLQLNYDNYIAIITSRTKMSPGEMLIMAFNTLFENVTQANVDFRTTFKQNWETCWSKSADQLVDISEYTSRVSIIDISSEKEELLDLSTFLTKLKAMKEYFDLCAKCVACFRSDLSVIGETFPTSEDLARPIRYYMNDFYRRHLVCTAPLTLGLTIAEYVRTELSADIIQNNLAQLTRLVIDRRTRCPATKDKLMYLSRELDALCWSLRKLALSQSLEQQLDAIVACQHIGLLQRNSFQWFHESDIIVDYSPVMPIRPQLMSNMRDCVTALLQYQKEIVALQAKFHELHGTVEQRLRWACGANPDLQDLFDSYSTMFSVKMDMIKSSVAILKAVSSTTNTIIQHEALRTATREALNSDSIFVSLVAECLESASLRETEIQNQPLTEDELSLFSMNPPNMDTDLINAKWIRSTEEKIAVCVKKVQADIQEERRKERQLLMSLKQSGLDLRQVFLSKQKLMVDVGAILRNIDKSGEFELPEVSLYLKRYRDFSDMITNLIKETDSEDFCDERATAVLDKLEVVNEMIPQIYEDLITFATTLKDENLYKTKRAGKAAPEEEDSVQSETTKEEKNAFAMRVLRRIRTKLEGREPDSLKKSSVSEQVDFVIREATHMDNLALLYEGWTAWI